jgi:hypothetical protein
MSVEGRAWQSCRLRSLVRTAARPSPPPTPTSTSALAMADPMLDPRLFSSSLSTPSQSYTAGPPQTGGHPYYHSAHHQQPPQLGASHAARLDPALGQTSPTGAESPDDDDDEQDDNGEAHAHATPGGSAKSPGDLKRARACDSCRGLKVRCDQDRPDVSCKRCAKAGRPWCVCFQHCPML